MRKHPFRFFLALVFGFCGLWFCLFPLLTSLYYIIFDTGLKGEGPSRYAIRLHRQIAPRYETYARERIASGVAETLDVNAVAATEWPLFGAMFLLNATESLQEEWQRDPSPFPSEPAVYARGALDGARDLLLDPKHAHWVHVYWGDNYLKEDNCFYRTLVISGLSSHHRLTGDDSYLPFLREQTLSLAETIDRSPHGLIDDYPHQCFPCDVGAALHAIKRADGVLGTDHSAMIARALRGFSHPKSNKLVPPPYMANPATRKATAVSRGSTNNFFGMYSSHLWPERLDEYYDALELEYWQSNWFLAGFRELPHGHGNKTYFDVDAGPVVGGLGTSASGLGIGTARSHGRFDHARALSVEMIACSWQLPNGINLIPFLVSNREHAPDFADITLLHNLTRTPPAGTVTVSGGPIPAVVWLILTIEALVSFVVLRRAWRFSQPPRRKQN
jgi:hypothetical protein